MNLDWMQALCMAMPGVTEQIMWGDDLVFKVAGKMFAVAALEPGDKTVAAFKCSPEGFAELVEREGIIPAPYAARHHWVALERFDALPRKELETLLREAYRLVAGKLPKKARESLLVAATSQTPAAPSPPRRRTAKPNR